MLVHDDYDYEANEYERHYIEDINYSNDASDILEYYYEVYEVPHKVIRDDTMYQT